MIITLCVCFWALGIVLLYNQPFFRFFFMDKAKATPTEKMVVAGLAGLTVTAIFFIISSLFLIWKSL